MSKLSVFTGLTGREVDVLRILWNVDRPMVASEIAKAEEGLTLNTVQAMLRKLLKKGCVEVADIVYSGNVLSRTYRPTISANEFAVMQVTEDYHKFPGISMSSLFSALLQKDDITTEEIEAMEQLLNEYKRKLKTKEGIE